jgi:hypothetical protein
MTCLPQLHARRRSVVPSRLIAARSRPSPLLVTRAEPTLTTSRRAEAVRVVIMFRAGALRRRPDRRENASAGAVGYRCRRRGGQGIQRRLHFLRQLAAASAADRADPEDRPGEGLASLQEGVHPLLACVLGNQVQFVEDQPARLGGKCRIVFFQFTNDRQGIASGVGVGIERRKVDDVQQQAGARQVLEETDAQDRRLRRPHRSVRECRR